MQNKTACKLLGIALIAAMGIASAATIAQPAPQDSQATHDQNPTKTPDSQGDKRPGSPERPGPVFGEVVAVRGSVLQMRVPGSDGLTRVNLAPDAQIIRDETLKTDVLKPGMKVTGSGRKAEASGTGDSATKVEVQTLTLEGGMGGPFMFFGGGGGPLMRGRRAEVFRKQNYSGSISFDATVKSIDPLVLADDQGNPLPVIIPDDVEVHRRVPRPIKDGDINAGARLVAIGEPTPDGLLNAHMILLFGAGSDRGSTTGTIMTVNAKGVTIRPRFEPRDLQIEVPATAKIYIQESLDLDSIQIGDTLAFTGKVTGGDAKVPTALVVNTISPADEEMPKIDTGDSGFFGGGSITATVKGKITGFDPLRVQTEDGREVTITVPGQLTYVRYHPLERSALQVGQKALFSGRSEQERLIADLVIVNPSLAMGPGF